MYSQRSKLIKYFTRSISRLSIRTIFCQIQPWLQPTTYSMVTSLVFKLDHNLTIFFAMRPKTVVQFTSVMRRIYGTHYRHGLACMTREHVHSKWLNWVLSEIIFLFEVEMLTRDRCIFIWPEYFFFKVWRH